MSGIASHSSAETFYDFYACFFDACFVVLLVLRLLLLCFSGGLMDCCPSCWCLGSHPVSAQRVAARNRTALPAAMFRPPHLCQLALEVAKLLRQLGVGGAVALDARAQQGLAALLKVSMCCVCCVVRH